MDPSRYWPANGPTATTATPFAAAHGSATVSFHNLVDRVAQTAERSSAVLSLRHFSSWANITWPERHLAGNHRHADVDCGAPSSVSRGPPSACLPVLFRQL